MYTFTQGPRTGNANKHMLLIVYACALLHTACITLRFWQTSTVGQHASLYKAADIVTRSHVRVTNVQAIVLNTLLHHSCGSATLMRFSAFSEPLWK